MAATHAGGDRPHRRVGRHHRLRRRRRARLVAVATSRGGRSASAATSARAPTAARSASRASPSRPAAAPRPPTSIVVNTHLYGLHVGSGGVILPAARRRRVRRGPRARGRDERHRRGAARAGTLRHARRHAAADPRRAPAAGRRCSTSPTCCARPSARTPAGACPSRIPTRCTRRSPRRAAASTASPAALVAIQTPVDDAKQRKLRAQLMTGRTIEHLDLALQAHDGYVDYVSGTTEHPRLEIAPLDVGPVLRDGVWAEQVAVLTSATIPSSLPTRLGLPPASTDVADVGSPFDYADAGAPVLRHAPARPARRRLSRRRARRAGRVDHGRRRAHAGAVHELQGDGPRRGCGARAGRRSRCSPSATCRSRRSSPASPPTRRRACSPRRVLPGHRRPGTHAQPRRRRPPAVPAARRPAAVGPPRGRRRRRRSPRSTCPAPRCCWPRRPGA